MISAHAKFEKPLDSPGFVSVDRSYPDKKRAVPFCRNIMKNNESL